MMKVMTTGLIAAVFAALFMPLTASAQDSNIYVQCPQSTGTLLHPTPGDSAIKCVHIVGADGMVTMADDAHVDLDGNVADGGKPLYIFSFAELPNDGVDPVQNSPEYAGWVMDQGMLAANAPAPTISVDEDDELFLTMTNVGMAVRPDLFDPHTVHWHGFPQAASIFDGVPDASISINMAASVTYYYQAQDAGTYMYHCHVEATEHMQMGMLGSLFVRPRQNKVATGASLFTAFAGNDANIANGGSTPAPAMDNGAVGGGTYAYNDGDGSTQYDVEYPIQIGSFDPDFHDASFTVQPLPFAAMKDRYFMLNGRGYPDTINPGTIDTPDPLTGAPRPSQPVSSLITAAPNQRILLRISNLNVTEVSTLGTNGLPMEVIALDARLLRDDAGVNMNYSTNSLTLGGGQSADVIITAPATAGTYFLYTKNLDQLANDAENFGGMMTEIVIN
jgi:FtsP/CotA-like multicopper oxidase with cupredoxin domain